MRAAPTRSAGISSFARAPTTPIAPTTSTASKASSLAASAPASEDAFEAVEVVGAIGVVGDRAKLEMPALRVGAARIREQVLDLLGLAVAQREHDPEVRVGAAGELAAGGRCVRCLEHLHVAHEDAAEVDVLVAGLLQRGDQDIY